MSCSSAVSHSLSWVAASVESRHRPFLVLHAPSCCPRSHPYRPPSAPPSLTPSTKGLLSIHIIFVFLKKNVLYRWNGTIWNLLWLTFFPSLGIFSRDRPRCLCVSVCSFFCWDECPAVCSAIHLLEDVWMASHFGYCRSKAAAGDDHIYDFVAVIHSLLLSLSQIDAHE